MKLISLVVAILLLSPSSWARVEDHIEEPSNAIGKNATDQHTNHSGINTLVIQTQAEAPRYFLERNPNATPHLPYQEAGLKGNEESSTTSPSQNAEGG